MKKLLKELSISLIMMFVCFIVGQMTLGCATKSPVKIQEDTITESRENIRESGKSTVQEDIKELSSTVQEIVRKAMEKLEIKTEKTTYTPPDSTGKQYLMDKTITTINKDTRQEEESRTEISDTLSATITRNDSTDTDMTLQSTANIHQEAERKSAISLWQAALMFLGGVTLIYIGIKIYKKKLP